MTTTTLKAPAAALKRCTRCTEEKPADQFYKSKGKPGGLQSCCKQCSKENVRKWQAANPERVKELGREWRATNPEYSRSRYASNPEVREKTIARAKAAYAANPEKSLTRSVADRGKSPVKFMLRGARNRAKQQGVPCTITEMDIGHIPDTCPALGVPMVVGRGRTGPLSASLDKRVGSAGYVSGNIAVISHRANLLKRDWTAPELYALADKSEDAVTAVELRAVARWIEEQV